MRFEHRDGYWLWRAGPVPPGTAGVTIGSLVIVGSGQPSEKLLRHEQGHVRQWRALGPVRFIGSYVVSYLRHRLVGWPHWAAYRRIPLEVDAEWWARTAGLSDDRRSR